MGVCSDINVIARRPSYPALSVTEKSQIWMPTQSTCTESGRSECSQPRAPDALHFIASTSRCGSQVCPLSHLAYFLHAALDDGSGFCQCRNPSARWLAQPSDESERHWHTLAAHLLLTNRPIECRLCQAGRQLSSHKKQTNNN